MPELYSKENLSQCCGCTACFAECPTDAITMVCDEEGFLYPSIDKEKCIECNACVRVCPLKEESKAVREETKTFIALKNKNKETILSSSSGGAFSAISDYILSEGGVIYGVVFDEKLQAVHIRTDNKAGRDEMRVSKYLQSDMKDIFSKVKTDADNGMKILFTGTPCQIEGLKRFLKKDYENLYLADIICYGVPSPLMFSEHIKNIEKTRKKKVKNYKCRSKVQGWHRHIEEAVFENGKKEAGTPLLQEHKVLFHGGNILRPSCYECQFTNLYRPSDITLGDFWGIEKCMPEWDDQTGTSIILVNSPKGEKLLEKIEKDVVIRKSDVYGRQPHLEMPVKKPAGREEFWDMYRKYGYKCVAAKYGRNNLKSRVKYVAKKLLRKS